MIQTLKIAFIILTSLFLFTRKSKEHSLKMANARTISQVVLDRNAFLPSLKLRRWSGCSELPAIWSLSGEIVAVLETSATLWLLLLVKNTNDRTAFGDPPLKRSFDLRDLTLFAISNVNVRLDEFRTFVLLARLSRARVTLKPVYQVWQWYAKRPVTKAIFSSAFQHFFKKALDSVKNTRLRQ